MTTCYLKKDYQKRGWEFAGEHHDMAKTCSDYCQNGFLTGDQ